MKDYSDEYEQKRLKADELEKEMKQKMKEVEDKKAEYRQKIQEIRDKIDDEKHETRKEELAIANLSDEPIDRARSMRSAVSHGKDTMNLKNELKQIEKEAARYEQDENFKIKEMDKEITNLRATA